MPREITSATTLDNLKREAKRWLRAHRVRRRRGARAPDPRLARRAGAARAPRRAARARPRARPAGLDRSQTRLPRATRERRYARVADALVSAYADGDAAAMQIVWDYFGHRRTWDAMRRYVRLDLGRHRTAARR